MELLKTRDKTRLWPAIRKLKAIFGKIKAWLYKEWFTDIPDESSHNGRYQ